MGTIYLVKNKHNGKVYVGQTNRSLATRWKEHRSWEAYLDKSSYLHKAIYSEGADAFTCEELCSSDIQSDLDFLEILFITALRSTEQGFGYNLQGGGLRVDNSSPVVRAKMRAAKLGRKTGPCSEKRRLSIIEARKNTTFHPVFTTETRRKISEGVRAAKQRAKDIR